MFPSVSFRQRCKQSHGVHPHIQDARRSLEKITRCRRSRRRGGVDALAAYIPPGARSRAEPYRSCLEFSPHCRPAARRCRHPLCGVSKEPPRRPREQDKQPFCSAPQRNIAEPMCRDKTGKGPSLCSSLKSQREGLVLQPRTPKKPPRVSDSASGDSEETLQVWTRCKG